MRKHWKRLHIWVSLFGNAAPAPVSSGFILQTDAVSHIQLVGGGNIKKVT